MKPPMQSSALQQNEHIIQHHHQLLQQQQQPQQQLPLQQIQLHSKTTTLTSATDLNKQQTRKTKLQQREFLVEHQLNFACSATAASGAVLDAPLAIPQSNLPANIAARRTQTYQQLGKNRHSSRTPQSQINNQHNYVDDEEYDAIQLVDLSTTPPNAPHTVATFTRHTDFTQREPAQRSSVISDCQYSRSSSSEDGSLSSDRFQFCSRSNTFDDAAENFIINFPGDTITHNRNDSILSLPLSETEPLLTNIEPTVADTNRAICLRKNSASLIYTRKEHPKAPVTERRYNLSAITSTATTKNNNCSLQKRAVQSTSSLNATPYASTTQQKHPQEHRRHHFSFHTNTESNRKLTKHLPATYYHQQRRSLQLNYNNNLVTTSTCSTNNNFCYLTGFEASRSSAPVHKNRSSILTLPVTSTTASVSRKQQAYSWYAPVYSALEEELEQDSRDSSPIHNLANSKKNHYQNRSVHNSTSTADNENVALLETRNQINIQAQLHTQSTKDIHNLSGKGNSTIQVPNTLPLQNLYNVRANSLSGSGDFSSVVTLNNYDAEGPHAGSLGLAGGPLPPRKRLKNFFKSLVGLKPSNGRNGNSNGNSATNSISSDPTAAQLQRPASPEIRITRTPSEQNLVVLRAPIVRQQHKKSIEKIVEVPIQGSSSSLNVVQQKIRNILRREGSASSLNQERSQSIVQYKGLRKCETMLALTRQTSLCSPVLSDGNTDVVGTRRTNSGIFNANGVEQIRPLNRLRNSATSINMTCSRCSSILSLAASSSRYSLNVASSSGAVSFINTAPNGTALRTSHLQDLQEDLHDTYLGNSNLSRSRSHSPDSLEENGNTTATANVTIESIADTHNSTSANCSRKSSDGANSTHSNTSISPPSNLTTATLNSSITPSATNTPTPPIPTVPQDSQIKIEMNAGIFLEIPQPTAQSHKALTQTVIDQLPVISMVSALADDEQDNVDGTTTTTADINIVSNDQQLQSNNNGFKIFTCKLCLVDVENSEDATTLMQCGCKFCTECMKAYVEYEISEGAYEISCPDAQCPAQGIVTLAEISNLTTANLMKKHHRYRLNREIELDKSRTWCPRAGCETVCPVGPSPQNDAAPSTSTSQTAAAISPNNDSITSHLCAVQCPSCKDIFCSSCKKTWHPNITCEEHSRRLVADGQDDIGIPFDNDLIKCCPMCAVPIEKDEGCAQMMCKRCKHVFCWYCLASLDDDFLLRHYDKGPCKNKLGHSRASVVWHRAQVIGIFAGFGILLLVASPLLLLAAPCIICCKCRSCSGSKNDDGDGELDEAAALQS